MKPRKRIAGPVRCTAGWVLQLLGLLAIAARVAAQPVVIPPSSIPSPPPTAPAVSTSESGTGAGGLPVSGVPLSQAPFRWGPVILHPHVSYALSYGTGIQSATNSAHRTAIQTFSPGIGFDLGNHWRLDYTPTITFYSESAFRDVVDHSIQLNGDTTYEDWTFALSQGVSITADPLAETASQTDQETFATAFSAACLLNSDVSLQFKLAQNLRFTQDFENSRDWNIMNWINQQWGPNLGGGVGVGFGYVDVDTGNDMTYEQFQGHITWHVMNKINLSFNAGAEIRQFLPSGTNATPSDLISPLFGLSLTYHPIETTVISVSAGQSVSASYFENQVTESASINASISQRLLQRFYLVLSGAYGNTRYYSSAQGFSVDRRDTYYSFNATLGTSFLKRGSASIFYSYSSNVSNSSGFGYSSDQVGFQVGYHY